MSINLSHNQTEKLQDRVFYVAVFFSVFFLIVLIRLYYLQVIKGPYYESFSQGNTIKEIVYQAARGQILDRNGRVIVDNRPSYDVVIIPQYVVNPEEMIKTLSSICGLPIDYLEKTWGETRDLPAFYPTVVISDVDFDAVVKIRSLKSVKFTPGDRYDFRGIEIFAHPVRDYAFGSLAANSIGYLREVSKDSLKSYSERYPGLYRLGDFAGVSGIERRWEPRLKGKNGYEQMVVDAVGNAISSEGIQDLLVDEEPEHGDNLYMTIDVDMQKTAEEFFVNKTGAVVAIDVRDGAVLTLVSSPPFDPSGLVTRIAPDQWDKLLKDPGKLFLNRAIQSAYPPGSTYKIINAIAGLEEKVIIPTDKVYCPGYYRFGNRVFRCWKEGGHGVIDIHRAIVESCDVFFYQLGLKLGVDRLANYAELFGLGHSSGIDLDGEKGGLIPTSRWKKERFGYEWQEGETLSIAIGQGYDLVTPMQNAVLAAEVANGGRKIRPYIVKRIESVNGDVKYEAEGGAGIGLIPVDEKTLTTVKSALAEVVSSPRGTAYWVRSNRVSIAGKTGTSQVVSEEKRSQLAASGHRSQDHAWFIAYAPVEQPEIAVSVLVEHGGHGSSAAAPIAKAVIEKYFELKEGIDAGKTAQKSF